jgi:hypothetical protein
MADRVNINPSTEEGGPDVLTDTITNLNAASLAPPAEAQRSKIGFGGDAVFIDVSAATPLPVTGTQLTTLHTDLAALLTELAQKLEPSDLNLLATAAKQDVAHADLGAILAKLSADPATQTTLAAVLAKLSSDPATQTTLASVLTKLTTTAGSPLVVRLSDGSAYLNLATTSDRLKVDVGGSLPAGTNNIGDVDVLTLPSLPAGSNAIGTVAVPVPSDQVGTLTDGRKTVAAAGTAEAIRSSLACKWVTVTALTSNTQQVNVGGSGVLATVGGSTGTPLFAGGSTTIPVDNANKVFVDARVSTEGVSFTVGT